MGNRANRLRVREVDKPPALRPVVIKGVAVNSSRDGTILHMNDAHKGTPCDIVFSNVQLAEVIKYLQKIEASCRGIEPQAQEAPEARS